MIGLGTGAPQIAQLVAPQELKIGNSVILGLGEHFSDP